jgi:hypothetical protein
MARDRGREPDAVRITTAAESRQAEIAGRQLRYVLSMTVRTLCFLGAIVASVAGIGWLWPILIAAALVLPYVAVVMANARHTRGDAFELVDRGTDVPRLGPAPHGPQTGSPRG